MSRRTFYTPPRREITSSMQRQHELSLNSYMRGIASDARNLLSSHLPSPSSLSRDSSFKPLFWCHEVVSGCEKRADALHYWFFEPDPASRSSARIFLRPTATCQMGRLDLNMRCSARNLSAICPHSSSASVVTPTWSNSIRAIICYDLPNGWMVVVCKAHLDAP